MKKTLCVIIAVIIALTSLAIVSYAGVPDIQMKADKTSGVNVGDIVTITVSVAKNSNLCSAQLALIYDKAFFEIVSFTPTDVMSEFSGGDVSKDRPTYAGVHVEGMLTDAAVLFTAQLKVLKRGGTIALEAEDVCYYTTGIVKELKYAEKDVNENLKKQTITISCPHNTDKTTTVTDATCSAEGKKVEVCKECGHKSETVIAKLAHDIEEVVVEPTYDKAGKKVEKCKNCGYVERETTIPALEKPTEEFATSIPESTTVAPESTTDPTEAPTEHVCTWSTWVTIKTAICKEDGLKERNCTVCGNKEIEAIPATGVCKGEWVMVKAPTATEKGQDVKKCTMCGEVLETREIPMAIKYKLGDVNDDGKITAVDARMILRYVAGIIDLTAAQKLAADTNKDGTIGATDARMILQYVVGIVKF